ncbi:MAG: hypothetical protein ONB15_12010 [candidate division KSB1 bacterium]|nr:hypothetical protein [candidate division KSB1 bacterium]
METAWDIYEVRRDPGNAWNWVALAVDVGAAVLPFVPAGVGLVVHGGKAAARADDVLDLVRGVQWAERFTGAGPEVMQGIRYLEQMANNPKILEPFRRGYAAELLRAEQLHQAGKLKGVEVMVEGGRVDFVLITDELVEFKYWTQSYTERHIKNLADQLMKYQGSGRPLILELARTKTNPITEAYIEDLLKELQKAGVRITREQIRLIDLP